MQGLDEGCLASILSLTTPKDVCRTAAVSVLFRSAAESDIIWEKFLPSDYQDIINQAVDAETLSRLSKKALYFRLCVSVLIDGGHKLFALERSSGKICCMVSARRLGITWGDTPEYWRWTTRTDSRFAEVAELLSVCWLNIGATLNCRRLSPNTTYAAYLVFKLTPDAYDLRSQQALVSVGALVTERQVFLEQVEQQRQQRSDGWAELKLGEFFIEEGNHGDEVRMCLRQVNEMDWKSGLIVQGIEVRPNY